MDVVKEEVYRFFCNWLSPMYYQLRNVINFPFLTSQYEVIEFQCFPVDSDEELY
jgi:hypothetical protein